MGLKDGLIAELKHESGLTKKMLERVPLNMKNWQPHAKSMPLGRLATHVAEITNWIATIINVDDFDFAKNPFSQAVAVSTEELISTWQENLDKALAALEQADDAEFEKIWVVRNGEQVYFQLQKKVAIRSWAFSHLIHHRGQLSVYLRLLDVPVPGMYGPTADEAFR